MTVFLRWALVETLFLIALVAGAVAYDGDIHVAGAAAVVAVLAVFLPASAYCGLLAWNEDQRGLPHVELAVTLCPMLSMVGTAAGFLVAFGADAADVQQRVQGASTGIVATVVGVSCAVCLIVEKHLVESA